MIIDDLYDAIIGIFSSDDDTYNLDGNILDTYNKICNDKKNRPGVIMNERHQPGDIVSKNGRIGVVSAGLTFIDRDINVTVKQFFRTYVSIVSDQDGNLSISKILGENAIITVDDEGNKRLLTGDSRQDFIIVSGPISSVTDDINENEYLLNIDQNDKVDIIFTKMEV